MNEKKGVLSGAIYLGISAFIAKFLGAIYRVPLTNILGGYGLGLYQMVFPVYSLLLDFSGAGLPSAVSRLISKSENKNFYAQKYLNSSVKLFGFLGILATFFMLIFSSKLSYFQGDNNAKFAYLALAPAVFFVSLISCFRGYFQGLMNMRPTAVSQVVEQVVKLLVGIVLIRVFSYDVKAAVAGATMAISISEIVAFLYLYFCYKRHKNKHNLHFLYQKSHFLSDCKIIIKTTFPITLIGIMIPLSQVFDSFLTINILSKYLENATSLFGILSGVVMTIINLPVSVCYGLATVAIPLISGSKNEKNTKKKSYKILLLTLAFSVPSAIFLFAFSPFTINLIFRRLSGMEKLTAINLLRLTSPVVILLSFLQATNAVLIGRGRLYTPIVTMLFGIILKVVLNVVLLNIPNINIYGGAVAIIACYFLSTLLNLILIIKKGKKNESLPTKNCNAPS